MAIKNLKGLGKQERAQRASTSAPAQKPVETQLLSEESSIAPFETIFDDFRIEAYPFYNFWEPDESRNIGADRGNRELSEIPRFIKVTWNRAPDLPRPKLQQLTPPSVGVRKFNNRLGTQMQDGYAFALKGVTFSPEHLSKNGFELIRKSLANGYIGPGTVETVVELPLHNAGGSYENHAKTSHVHQIDEDAFLTHPDMKGISVQELRANIVQMTNGAINSAKVAKKSKNGGALFNGKFSVGKTPFTGGNVQLDGVHPSSPALSIKMRTAVSADGEGRDQVVENVRKIVKNGAAASLDNSAHTKVKFNHPVLGGAISRGKVNMLTKPEHAENAVAVSQMIPQLQALADSGVKEEKKKIDIPSFPSPPGLRPIEYVGYILEKYRRSPSGVFEKVSEHEITDQYQTDFVDTKVVYGETYRYRIKALVRWTRPNNIGPLGPEPLTVTQAGSQTKNIAPFKSSYFAGEWSPTWAYAAVLDTTPPPAPDELSVRPESSKRRVHVTFKMPQNSQRDINSLRLLRKKQTVGGQDVSGWEAIFETDPKNALYIDEDVDFHQNSGLRYIYAAQSLTRHGEESSLSDQLGVRLNSEWRVQGEMPVDFVSCSGVKPEQFGAFATIPMRRAMSELVALPKKDGARIRSDIGFSGREGKSNALLNDREYVVRIESLDTGEIRDVDLSMTYTNLPTLNKTVNSDVTVRR